MKINHTDEELLEWMLEQAEELLEIEFTGNEDPQSYEMPIEEHERHVQELERAVEGWLSGVWSGSAFEKHAYATNDRLFNFYPEGFYSDDPLSERRAKLSYLRRISVEEDEECVLSAIDLLEEGAEELVYKKFAPLPGGDDPGLMRNYLAELAQLHWSRQPEATIRNFTPFGWRPYENEPG